MTRKPARTLGGARIIALRRPRQQPNPDDAKQPSPRPSLLALLRRRAIKTPDGVRFKPAGLRAHAYSVRFPDGRRMRVRPTTDRVYADLAPIFGPDPALQALLAEEELGRPGERALHLDCGSGAAAAELARRVGRSGGVVALNRDGESIRFARRRYAEPQIAFELGGAETLAGELDEAFDVVLLPLAWLGRAKQAAQADRQPNDEPSPAAEAWRVLRGGGLALAVAPPHTQNEEPHAIIEPKPGAAVRPVQHRGRVIGFVLTKPEAPPQNPETPHPRENDPGDPDVTA